MFKFSVNVFHKMLILPAIMIGIFAGQFSSFAQMPFLISQANTKPSVNIEIVLDSSGSMAALLDQKPKITIAKEVVLNLVKQITKESANTRVGLRVYGHQYDKTLHNCQDTKLEIQIGKINPTAFSTKLPKIQPKGYTPIVYSLQQALKDFPTGQNNHIILVTDGEETCDGNIKTISQMLKDAGIIVHVVSYKMPEKERMTLTPLYIL